VLCGASSIASGTSAPGTRRQCGRLYATPAAFVVAQNNHLWYGDSIVAPGCLHTVPAVAAPAGVNDTPQKNAAVIATAPKRAAEGRSPTSLRVPHVPPALTVE